MVQTRSQAERAALVPGFVKLWLIVASAVVVWDASFVLLRPKSFPGGEYAHFFPAYDTYIQVDQRYHSMTDSFVVTQSLMNLVETVIGLVGVYMASSRPVTAAMMTFLALSMTLGKTLIYILDDYVGGFHFTKHNDTFTFVTLYVIPNGLWILVPALCLIALAKRIIHAVMGHAKYE